MDATKFRNLVKQVSGKEISTEQATNFLDIFQSELDEAQVRATREFIEDHFGTK